MHLILGPSLVALLKECQSPRNPLCSPQTQGCLSAIASHFLFHPGFVAGPPEAGLCPRQGWLGDGKLVMGSVGLCLGLLFPEGTDDSSGGGV